jgi:hypothetical protein
MHAARGMTPEKIEPEKKVARAFEEMRRAREELRAQVGVLGKEAEELVKLLEVRLAAIAEAAFEDAQAGVAFVRDKVAKLAAEAEKRISPPPPQ